MYPYPECNVLDPVVLLHLHVQPDGGVVAQVGVEGEAGGGGATGGERAGHHRHHTGPAAGGAGDKVVALVCLFYLMRPSCSTRPT